MRLLKWPPGPGRPAPRGGSSRPAKPDQLEKQSGRAPVFQRSARGEVHGGNGPTLRLACGQTMRAFCTRRVTTQLLVLEIGRDSAISTMSPILNSPFSSCAWYLRDLPTILP